MKRCFPCFLLPPWRFMLVACGGSSSSTPCGFRFHGGVRLSSAYGQTLKVMLSEEPSSGGDSFTTTLNKWAEETGNSVELMVIPYDDQPLVPPQGQEQGPRPRFHHASGAVCIRMSLWTWAGRRPPSIFEPMALEIISEYNSDKLSCLPLQFTITNVFYNKDAFEAAGLEVPLWTTAGRWMKCVRGRCEADGRRRCEVRHGRGFLRARYDNPDVYERRLHGGKRWRFLQVAINSQANIDTLQTFVDKNNEGIMPKAIWAGGSTDNPGDYFKNGDVGMYFSGSWNYNAFTTDITGFEWGVMPSPVGSVSGSAILGGSGLAVPENSANKDLALSFIKWFYGRRKTSLTTSIWTRACPL